MLCGLEDHNILGNEIKYLGQWNRVLEVIKKIIYYEIHVTTEKGVLNAFYPKTLKVVLDYCCFLKVVVLCLIVLTVPYNSLSLFFTVLTLFLLDPTVSWKLLNWFYGFEKLLITVISAGFYQRWIEIFCQLIMEQRRAVIQNKDERYIEKVWQFYAYVKSRAL